MVTALLRLIRCHPDTVELGVLRFKWAELQAEPRFAWEYLFDHPS